MKISILAILIFITYCLCQCSEVNPNLTGEQPALNPLELPNPYSPSYTLGISDGAHISTTNAYVSGLFWGLTFNYIGIIIASGVTKKSEPIVFPDGVNISDYKKGYYETSKRLNRSSAVKGASTAAIIETVLLMGAMIFAAGD
ncbi:MAG TPA: hypothetical protein PLE74_04550 [Candidatus Cloacimonadota bacterium]|nr:hypothetical protein [Candidatus Cloacimonadota bacterium]HPT71530.1 hypothetical protein [Candidatus Cloacimonadota bacterium]